VTVLLLEIPRQYFASRGRLRPKLIGLMFTYSWHQATLWHRNSQ